MYLIDTNVISEARKGPRTHPGVQAFFRRVTDEGAAVYLSVVTVGELRRGVELIRHRGDADQARRLAVWLDEVLADYGDHLLPFGVEEAQVWGRLRVPHAQHEIDKQIAATALMNDLTVVTRNVADFAGTGVRLLDPFAV